MNTHTEDEFRECFIESGWGWPVLIGWYCARCGLLVPNITDVPTGEDRPLAVHIAWHEEVR